MKTFLRAKREAKNMTQLQLANVVLVSEHYIYLIEAGMRRPSVKVAKRIATILNFDWTRFYEEEKDAG